MSLPIDHRGPTSHVNGLIETADDGQAVSGTQLRWRYQRRLMLLPLLDFVFSAVAMLSYGRYYELHWALLFTVMGFALPLYLVGMMLYRPVEQFIDGAGEFDLARKRLFGLQLRSTIWVLLVVACYAAAKFIWDPGNLVAGESNFMAPGESWRLFVIYLIFMPFLTYYLVSDCVARVPVDLLRRYNIDGMDGRGRFMKKIGFVIVICSVLPLSDQVLELHNWSKNPANTMGQLQMASHAIEEGLNAFIALCLATWVVLRSLDGPLRRLLNALAKVRNGDLSVRVPVSANDDLGLLTAAFNDMVESLRYRDHMRFGAGVNPDASLGLAEVPRGSLGRVEQKVTPDDATNLELHSYRGAILVISLDEFDALSERLPAERSFEIIEGFYSLVSDAVLNRKGVIVDRMSNMVMAVFRDDDDDIAEADAHWVEAQRAVKAFNDVRHLLQDQVFLVGLQLNVRAALAEGDLFEAAPEGKSSNNFSADHVLLLGTAMDRALELVGLGNVETDSILLDESVPEEAENVFEPREVQHAVLRGYSGRGEIRILTGEQFS